MLTGKKIIIGITGSIAAYKTTFLVRLLVKSGAEVQVIATPSALDFVTPLTLSTLSGRPVYSEFVKNKQGEWVNHVDLALWADLIVIAPVSSNTLAKMANALCDNLLLAVYLSAKCPVYFAPAMDLDMYKHPGNKANIDRLVSFGNTLIPAGSGFLASGLEGEGRMAEPEEIFSVLLKHFQLGGIAGKKILITAGPTYEPIDPVRFIGNRSSGKMGYSIAKSMMNAGGIVTLISGPSSETLPLGLASFIRVESAAEMFDACVNIFHSSDIVIMSAAVADYTPVNVADQKIKKKSAEFTLELQKTTDILSWMGQHKKESQILVGFALETENEIENAEDKLKRKNLDMIVLNSLRDAGAGFGHSTNQVTIIDRKTTEVVSLRSKDEIADILTRKISG
jgi:phosphopantothenoylcysteine decarboxylase/phosphopantothenate--cysteine ligase